MRLAKSMLFDTFLIWKQIKYKQYKHCTKICYRKQEFFATILRNFPRGRISNKKPNCYF